MRSAQAMEMLLNGYWISLQNSIQKIQTVSQHFTTPLSKTILSSLKC